MSPFVAYHATSFRHRKSICERGLLACRPRNGRLFGVYVFRLDCGHPTFSRRGLVRWNYGGPTGAQDCWEVAYIGPMAEDRYVENGYVLLESVSPNHITLITDNTGNT